MNEFRATADLSVGEATQKGFEVCFSLLACFTWGVSGEELECRFRILKTVGYILEQENHQVAEVGRDLWSHLVQPPAQEGPFAGDFWMSPRTDTAASQGSLTVSGVETEHFMFEFVPKTSCLYPGHH